MRKITEILSRLQDDEDGASLIEYTVLIGILLTGVMLTIALVGTWVGNKWTALNSVLP